jgi:lipoprotein-releasing system ATP-binding protein
MSNIIVCENLGKSFKEADKPLVVLRQIDLVVQPHQLIAILGSSGAGKSTLLHLLGGLDVPSMGKVFWHDQDIHQLSERKKCRLRNKHLGFVYQFHHLLPEFTALENVAMPLLIGGIRTHYAKKHAREMLSRVELTERETHRIGELSGGERQRVAIARALVTKPHCVLADEPTGNLDQATSHHILQVMLNLQKDLGTSFVIATHDLSLADAMQKRYRLEGGELLETID